MYILRSPITKMLIYLSCPKLSKRTRTFSQKKGFT